MFKKLHSEVLKIKHNNLRLRFNLKIFFLSILFIGHGSVIRDTSLNSSTAKLHSSHGSTEGKWFWLNQTATLGVLKETSLNGSIDKLHSAHGSAEGKWF